MLLIQECFVARGVTRQVSIGCFCSWISTSFTHMIRVVLFWPCYMSPWIFFLATSLHTITECPCCGRYYFFFLSLLMVFNPLAYLWLILIILARILFSSSLLLTLTGIRWFLGGRMLISFLYISNIIKKTSLPVIGIWKRRPAWMTLQVCKLTKSMFPTFFILSLLNVPRLIFFLIYQVDLAPWVALKGHPGIELARFVS